LVGSRFVAGGTLILSNSSRVPGEPESRFITRHIGADKPAELAFQMLHIRIAIITIADF